MKRLSVIIILLLPAIILSAQQKVYSIEDVWNKTLNQYPTLTAKREMIKEQELKKQLAKKQNLPDVNFQAQQSYGSSVNVPGSYFPLPGIYTTSGSKMGLPAYSGSNLYSSAVLQWNVIQFGRLKTKLEEADAAINIGTHMLKVEQWRLMFTVTQIYFTALKSIAMMGIAKADSNRLYKLLDLLKAQSNAGLRPGADTLLLKSSLLQSTGKIKEQGAVLNSLLEQLSAFIGERVWSFRLDTSVYYRYKEEDIENNEHLPEHPSLQLMNAQITYNEAQRKSIKKEAYPSIGLMTGIGMKGSGYNVDGSFNKRINAPWTNASGNYLVGIGLSWNLSSLWDNKIKVGIAEQKVASVRADREAAENEINMQYASSKAAGKLEFEKLQDAYASLQFSKKAYELYETRYQSGLINLIELLQLQKDLQETESNYTMAVYSYWDELINQAAYLGDPAFLLKAIHN